MIRRKPLGYQVKRDTSRYRFALPNPLFLLGIFSSIEIAIIAYLNYCHQHSAIEDMTEERISAAIHVSRAVTMEHLKWLIEIGIVTEDLKLVIVPTYTDHYFTMPNEIFLLGLKPKVFAVYDFLLFLENRHTHTCHPSYKMIGLYIGASVNTVVKCVAELEEKKLVSTSRTRITDKYGRPRNGTLLYKILPIQIAMEEFYRHQLERHGCPF